MRRYRTLAALLGLLALVASGLSSVTCDLARGSPLPTLAHTAHGPSHADMDHGAGDEPDAPPTGSGDVDCRALMACGAGLRGVVAAVVHADPGARLDDAPRVAFGKPSSTDLTQDPPPPRRDA
jgi:hypothetical protein